MLSRQLTFKFGISQTQYFNKLFSNYLSIYSDTNKGLDELFSKNFSLN